MKKILILLNDADPLLARVYKNKFKKDTGWDSVITSDYDEALKTVEQEKPDIVLTDIILAGSDKTGFDLIKSVRENTDEKIAKTAIVVLTDLGQNSDIQKAMELGATKYLVKSQIMVKDVETELQEML